MENREHHSGVYRRPYEASFSCRAKLGLRTYLSVYTLSGITSEDLWNQFSNYVQLYTAYLTENEDKMKMNVDKKVVEPDN